MDKKKWLNYCKKSCVLPKPPRCIYVRGLGKKIGRFKLDTNWVHIVPMTTCFFQSRVQKNTHHHKGCDRLTSRKYYCNTNTKKLRQIIIGFDTPPTTAVTRTTTSSPSPTLPVMPAMQARVGAWATAITIAVRLRRLHWSHCCPCHWPGLVIPAGILRIPVYSVPVCHRPWPYGRKHSSLKAAIR